MDRFLLQRATAFILLLSYESPKQKFCILTGATFMAFSALIFSSLYWSRYDSIHKFQEQYAQMRNVNEDVTFYDINCGAPFSDQNKAIDYLNEM